MNPKLKKIIAREGLIIFSLIFFGAIIELLRVFFLNLRPQTHIKYLYASEQIIETGLQILFILYPVYLFVRFIVWAIKTLRGR